MHERDEEDTDGDGEGETYRVDTSNTGNVADTVVVTPREDVEGGGKEVYVR